MKKLFVFATVLALRGALSWASTSPTEVNIKIYEVWVSPNANCTDMTRIYNEANPSTQNMANNPTFGEVSVANGTYNCIAWKMSDVISYVPAANDGTRCVQGTTYTRDIFRDGTSTCPDGTTMSGTGTVASPIEDKPCIYVSVEGDPNGDAMIPTAPMLLDNAYVVTGDISGTMVTDFTNKILDTGFECDCDAPNFSFR